ncbi:major facilitator transporter [Rhodopirellula maiorica SM1]|uniref:Major facilitator transporter n=1 Tax=Rhodopirellula maiorica SM1 TaxID=1265738 RepID=M5RM34_9BACT|nr:MFS transporter [Rhodopirellula maiorica]EMI20378.1 major facilitator transporter [Rhodopirellula maiorica SM1]
MVGLGESYFAAFALAVGLGEVSAGLVGSVPLFFGGVAQLISPAAVRWFGFEQRWVIFCGCFQAAALTAIALAAMFGSISLTSLLVFASMYWAAGLATGPAWNTWIERMVPARVRTIYFARRTKWAQVTTLLGLVSGGLLLQWAEQGDWVTTGFAIAFFGASGFRLLSVAMLAIHRTAPASVRETKTKDTLPLTAAAHDDSEPNVPHVAYQPQSNAGRSQSPHSTVATLLPNRHAESSIGISAIRLLGYLVFVQGMVQLSGPYFSPYMLEKLSLSYRDFVTLLALAFVSKIIALSYWGNFGRRYGAKRLLWIGGIGIVPIASLWILSSNFWWIAVIQIISGMIWAAYELGFFLLIFDAVPASRRTKMLTLYNFANCTSWCIGAAIGGGILAYFGATEKAYWMLFGISSLGRFLALGLLIGIQPGRRLMSRVRVRVLSVRPNGATLDSPVLPSLQRRSSTAAMLATAESD